MSNYRYRPAWFEFIFALAVEFLAAFILFLVAQALRSIPQVDRLITYPPTVLGAATLFFLLSALFVKKAINLGPPVEVSMLPSYGRLSFTNRFFSPALVTFLCTFLLMLYFVFLLVDYFDWPFILFLLLLVVNGVREFSKDYYIHREAFDRLMAQTLRTIQHRCCEAAQLAGVSEGRIRLCVYLYDGLEHLLPNWTLGMGNDGDQTLIHSIHQGTTVGIAFRTSKEMANSRPVDLITEWGYTKEQQQIVPNDIRWEYSFPLLAGDPEDIPLGVLKIDANFNLDVERNGNQALGMIRSVGLEYADQIVLQLIIGPIRAQAGRRLV